MSRGIDKVKVIRLAIGTLVFQCNTLGLNSDAAFSLELHRVEYLLLHLAILKASTKLNQTIRKCGLAMVDMSDDGEVAGSIYTSHNILVNDGSRGA